MLRITISNSLLTWFVLNFQRLVDSEAHRMNFPFPGDDGVLKINPVAGTDMQELVIKLTPDAANNNHLFIGEWKCGDKSWIVIGRFVFFLFLSFDL